MATTQPARPTRRTKVTKVETAPALARRVLPARHDLPRIAAGLESSTPHDILAWAIETYTPRITLACSFGGPSGMVLLDMVMELDATVPVFYLDTRFLFPETYALVKEASRRYGITPKAVRPRISVARQAEQYGGELWARDPDRCCEIRKVLPQQRALKHFDAWITGIRRDQSSTRRATPVVEWDAKFGLAKISPLANWSEREVWQYISTHKIPTNALHEHGYPSIGCTHCTRPIGAGEDLRAGRWSGFEKTECGLHTKP
jgi:phosphoadenosine phosphosulfate reductase